MKPLEPTDPRLPEVVERLKRGAKLHEESKKLGYNHNGPLRAALRALIGHAEYDTLMEGRAGWTKEQREARTAQTRKDDSRISGQKATPHVPGSKPVIRGPSAADPRAAGAMGVDGRSR
jgi:hypothetical protein